MDDGKCAQMESVHRGTDAGSSIRLDGISATPTAGGAEQEYGQIAYLPEILQHGHQTEKKMMQHALHGGRLQQALHCPFLPIETVKSWMSSSKTIYFLISRLRFCLLRTCLYFVYMKLSQIIRDI